MDAVSSPRSSGYQGQEAASKQGHFGAGRSGATPITQGTRKENLQMSRGRWMLVEPGNFQELMGSGQIIFL